MEKPKPMVQIGNFGDKTAVHLVTSDGLFMIELSKRAGGWIAWDGGELEIEEWPEAGVRWHGVGKAFDIAD